MFTMPVNCRIRCPELGQRRSCSMSLRYCGDRRGGVDLDGVSESGLGFFDIMGAFIAFFDFCE
jgi:hypothetical protein